jgi:hypothetical protein
MGKIITRRRLIASLVGLGAAGIYPFVEARLLRVVRERLALPRLPAAFAGLKVAFLADIHHSATIPLSHVRKAVALALAEKPDVILLGGDYVAWASRYIAPCTEALRPLAAPLGVFSVLGNHDSWQGAPAVRAGLERAGFTDLTNRGVWLRRGQARLRLGGVGDLWTENQDLAAALGDIDPAEGALVLSHNPDFAETLVGTGVDLLLSGHTHGGQVVVPFLGSPVIPSRYGMKYAGGLCRGPRCLVYVTRGVGTVGPPVRFACRPEVNVLELARA